MADSDPLKTQRDIEVDLVTELRAVGLADAEEIGRGGFGIVYRCSQPSLDRIVAVKVLTCGLDENRERFLREQRAMGRLTGHPNIVGVLEVGETKTSGPYLVMPYHPQGSLGARIRRIGPLPVEEVLCIGVKLAGALQTAHDAEVLHRDVKPANILLSEYGEPALTDFGIAHLAGGFQTATGTVTGSPAFTAPEVLGGDPPSRASDVYGLGATLFCALTGHAAFERRSGEQVVAQFLRITNQPIPDLRERGIPDDVCAVIEAAMGRDAQDRPTAAMFGAQLQRVQRAHGFGVDRMALRVEPDDERIQAPLVRPAHRIGTPAHSGGTTHRYAGNLPQELTSFVDRRAQVSEVKNLLSGSCLVTLTGIGGVGKSRLALRVAHKLQRDFGGGVWLVELVDLRDPALVIDVVAAAFGVRQPSRPTFEALVELLSDREVLVVLDNCEHVIEAAAQLVESLLRACPLLRVLATSRESLGVGGETVLAVPPLRFPEATTAASLRGAASYDAVTLFTERAAAVVPGFHLDEDNQGIVAAICARLDGLPLAIELAAARLRTLSAEQILARLTDRFALLTRGSRAAPTRQQTLAWCIGWSYDLCAEVEQQLWGRLSVFAGSFELDAAEDICGADLTEPKFLDSLSALVDKSIVIREEANSVVRFRMLETVQEYGMEKITEAGEAAELRRLHREWYGRLALKAEADWVSPHQLELIGRLTHELPNLRKALESSVSEADAAGLRTATALHAFWGATGRLSEGSRWCDRLLASTPAAASVDRAKALQTTATFSAQLGDLPTATRRVVELQTLAEQTGDPATAALLAYADGYTAVCRGDLAQASARLNDPVIDYDDEGDIALRLRSRGTHGWVYVLMGDMPSAIACLEEALAIADSHGETVYRSQALRPLAFALWRQGQDKRATELLKEALRSARRVVNPLVAAVALEVLAWIAAETTEARRSATLLGAAHGISHPVRSSLMFPHMLTYHEESERRIRGVLGSRGFESAYKKGGAMSFEAAIAFALGEQEDSATPGGSAGLTTREHQVVDLIAEGLTNRQIAAQLVISQRTAQGHVEHILTKLGFTRRAQIAAWAAEHHRDTSA